MNDGRGAEQADIPPYYDSCEESLEGARVRCTIPMYSRSSEFADCASLCIHTSTRTFLFGDYPRLPWQNILSATRSLPPFTRPLWTCCLDLNFILHSFDFVPDIRLVCLLHPSKSKLKFDASS
jgi:hypothetical protein